MMSSPRSLRILRKGISGYPVAGILTMLSAGAFAQETLSGEGAGRAISIVPRVSFTETLTDNVRLTNVGRQSEQITQISPGIRVNLNGARVKGYFDYALNQTFYAQNSSPGRSENALNTFGTLEAIDNWAFLDFNGSISQQSVSAFGTKSIDNSSINSNRTEVSNYRISPYIRGQLGDLVSYNARYSRSVTSSEAAAASGIAITDALVNVRADRAFGNLGWLANASRQNVDFSSGRPTELDRLSLGLSYALTPQLSVSVNAGREANNYTSLDKKYYLTSGFGVNWSPSPTTRLQATRDQRSFGEAHSLNFEHRTARTAWRFTDFKDVSATPNQGAFGSLGSIYDLLFSQFAFLEPNTASRAQLVNSYLLANGINPNAVVVNSFLSSALTLQRRQDLSFALLGVRDTITFIATRSKSSRRDTLSAAVDDLTASAVVRQHGLSVNYTHRLTPDYSLGVLVSQQNSTGVSSLQGSTIRFLNLSLTGRVGKQATVSVGGRHVVSSGASPYVENALTSNLIVRF